MRKKIYIAGAVSGETEARCRAKFAAAVKLVEAAGYEAINPLDVVGTWDVTWIMAMRLCIAALMGADALYLLPCGRHSTGANIEMNLAAQVKIPIVTQLETLNTLYKWNS